MWNNRWVMLMACLISHLSFLICEAQTLTVNGPSHIAAGQQFRLSYTVNTQNVSGFRVGNIPDAFEVLMGPSTSTQSSIQIINGRTTQSSAITYTYILVATKNGTFTIPPAHITAEGNAISSQPLKITVSGQAQQQQGGAQQQGGGRQRAQEPMRAAGTAISGSDLFIRVSANKHRVHEQEPILLTYKVYTLVDLTQLEGKMPELNGFHTQEVQLPQQKSFKIETLNGRPYRTVTWSQYVMFPQITGKLKIPPITFHGIVVQQNRNIDPFEAFFNGGSGYVEVKKDIVAPSVEIQVDPLPQRPADFSGGVGHFNISASLTKTEVKANDPVTLRVVVSGVGNLKLIKQPVVNIPKDFDKYDPKLTEKTKLTTSGVEGSMIYDYLIVPRHPGQFEIPPVTFTYYDTQSNSYKTVKTEAFTLDVDKGKGSQGTPVYTGQEDVELLNQDIRYIKTGNTTQHALGHYFFGSRVYWLSLALLLLVFVSLFVIFRRRAIENANVVKQRAGKANKVATRRLKKASRLMAANQPSQFYDEVLRALWGYVGDKLNIPVEQLSHDNIADRLTSRGVDETIVQQFIGAIDECEFERYAPGDPKGNMNKVYEKAMTAIEKIENSMKKGSKKTDGGMNRVVLLAVIMLSSFLATLSAHAQSDSVATDHPVAAATVTKADADSAYAAGRYQDAIRDYEALLKQGVSADLYYNLGNAYYRTEDITRAVLNYERAFQLSPGDKDIRHNLQMARSKTIDKITPETEFFFITWMRAVVNVMSVDAWAKTALGALALAIVLALVYLFAERLWLRKLGFFGGGLLLLLFLVCNLFAYLQKNELTHHRGAIVMSSAVNVKSTPAANGTDLFILHEGTRVDIIDDQMQQWKQIRVADGKEGWIETSQIETI
jgi:tetratricopeptide (TPR) repeat protein